MKHRQQHHSHLWTKTGGWWWCSRDIIIIRGWDYTAQVIPMIAWQAMELSFSSNATGTKTLKTWVLWAKHDLTSAVCNFDAYCRGISKRILSFVFQEQRKILEMGITGPEGHPLSRPEEVISCFGRPITHFWSVYVPLNLNVLLTSFLHRWKLRPCSVPSLLVTVWTVLCTSPRWWARVRLTRSHRPAGKVSVSFPSPHTLH